MSFKMEKQEVEFLEREIKKNLKVDKKHKAIRYSLWTFFGILLSDTTAKIVYTPSENGFFAKSVFGTVNYVATDGKSAFQEIQIRVFNLRNPYFIAFTIVLLILISLYYRYRKILNKRFKQIFKIIKMRLK